MALVFPYALDFLSDVLEQGDTVFNLRRNQELSGSADGRFWSAALARPLWTVNITLGQEYAAKSRAIDAKVRALGEGSESFLFEDRSYWPAGGVYPGTAVTLHTIGAARTTLRLTGLPSGYKVHPGDRFSAIFGGRYYFGEFAEGNNTVDADPDVLRPPVPGSPPTPAFTTPTLAITPPLPLAATTGVSVELYRPILRAQIPPGGYKAYTASRLRMRGGAALTLLQKV